MIRKEKKGLLLLLACVTIIWSIYFFQYIVRNLPLLYGTDLRPQWYLFYEEFSNLIKNFFVTHSFPFYSWHLFLGTNFFASKSYYLMGDIFNYIGLFLNGNFFNTAMILEIIKFYVSAIGMYVFLSKLQMKPIVKIIGSLAYTFSGWAIFFSGQMVFHSFYAWLPYYFMAMEDYLQYKKGYLFSFFTAVLLFTNFYFFFTISLLSPIYFLYRYGCINGNLKGWFKYALKLIGYYCIGVLMTMLLTLPTIFYMLQNDQLGNFKEGIFYSDFRVYIHYLVSALVPNYLYIYKDNIFETGQHYTREICMYSSALIVILSPQFIRSKNRVYKHMTLGVYILFFIILIFPLLDSALHGFADPSLRWTMFIIFFNIMTACNMLNDLDSLDYKLMRKCVMIYSIFLVFIIPFYSLCFEGSLNHISQWILFLVFAAICNLYLLTLKRNRKRDTLTYLLVLVVAELSISGYTLYHSNLDESKNQDYEFLYKVTHVLEGRENGLNNYLESLNPINTSQYYRIYIPHDSLYWSYSHNMSLNYKLNGVMTYDSTYAPSLNKLKEIVPSVKDFDSEWIFNIKDRSLIDFLNVKYAVVTDINELPAGENWVLIDNDYNYGLQVYENENYRSLGTTYNRVKPYKEFVDTSELMNTVFCNEVDYQKIEKMVGKAGSNLKDIMYINNQLFATIDSEGSSFLILTLPYDQGWNITVDGKKVETFSVNGGFLGFAIPGGISSIQMTFTPKGFKTGAICSVIGILLFALTIIYHKKRKKGNQNKDMKETSDINER